MKKAAKPKSTNGLWPLRFTLNGNQATTVTLDMLKENGRWKVDEVVAP